MAEYITSRQLVGKKVIAQADGKTIGKARRVVYHPTERRCVGIIVKRPDVALMFHRKDLFAAFDCLRLEDGAITLLDVPGNADSDACARLNLDWENCVIWAGMPALTESGETVGHVGKVTLDARTGDVVSVELDEGSASDAILGKRVIDASMIRGFKRGMGEAVVTPDGDWETDEEVVYGAVLVSDAVLDLESQGGWAAQAGQATAVVRGKTRVVVSAAKEKAGQATASARPKVDAALSDAKEMVGQATASARPKVDDALATARPKAQAAAKTAGEALNKGAIATARQISKSKGMFKAFKEEYDKARHEE